MFRPSRWCILALCVTAACAVSRASHADDVAAYLEQLGLKELLAVHLEKQLEDAPADQRTEIVVRLAALYAELLESTKDEARRVELEQRGRRLLTTAPASSVDDLRLALLRASYRSAERIAEQHRLRLSTPADVDAARKTLSEIIGDLGSLRQQLREKAELTERRLSRSIGAEAISLSQAIERLRSLHAQTTFLQAWSIYYQSWLAGTGETARVAEPLFAELMGTESTTPLPDDISVDLRANESVARSILGMGLCKSLTSSAATALAWIELLDDPNAFEPLRTQAPVWKISVYLENADFAQVRALLDERRASGEQVPLPWLRLVVVNALEAAERNRVAAELARAIVLDLAERGELDQILDLAERYGVAALGETGFALQYVRGVLAYQAARRAHASEEPSLDPIVRAKYEQAQTLLTQALAERDVGQHEVAASSCRRFVAWCEYFRGNFLAAQAAFDALGDSLDPEAAADARWMAIVCLDRLVSAGGSPELRESLSTAVDRFLALHPANEHAAELVLKRTLSAQEVSMKAVNDLLAIPPGSSVYASAQSRAADLLYRLFREATGRDRPSLGAQYLEIELGMIDAPTLFEPTEDATEMQRVLGRCRRALEVALADDVNNCTVAARVFRAVDDPDRFTPASLIESRDELRYRRLQERLCADDVLAAEKLADQSWTDDESSMWSNLGARAVFRFAQRILRDDGASMDEQRRALELVAKHGGRVLREYAGNAAVFDQPNVLAFHAAVADASFRLWEQTGDAERGRAGVYLYEMLVAARPQNRAFLVAAATLNERLGSKDKALDYWRRLAAGTPAGTEPWFEAKLHVMQLLAAIDQVRARQVMDQHKLMYPEYGPDPWGPMLRGLDAQIPVSQPREHASTHPETSAP